MKDIIVERLLSQGHITVKMADSILNDGLEKATILTELKNDGIISNHEIIILLKDNSTLVFPNIPQQPFMPYQPYNPEFPGFPGNPYWYTTTAGSTSGDNVK